MPGIDADWPNVIRYRIRDPRLFTEKYGQRRIDKGVHMVFATLKTNPKKSKLQSLHFDKNAFGVEDVKAWLDMHPSFKSIGRKASKRNNGVEIMIKQTRPGSGWHKHSKDHSEARRFGARRFSSEQTDYDFAEILQKVIMQYNLDEAAGNYQKFKESLVAIAVGQQQNKPEHMAFALGRMKRMAEEQLSRADVGALYECIKSTQSEAQLVQAYVAKARSLSTEEERIAAMDVAIKEVGIQSAVNDIVDAAKPQLEAISMEAPGVPARIHHKPTLSARHKPVLKKRAPGFWERVQAADARVARGIDLSSIPTEDERVGLEGALHAHKKLQYRGWDINEAEARKLITGQYRAARFLGNSTPSQSGPSEPSFIPGTTEASFTQDAGQDSGLDDLLSKMTPQAFGPVRRMKARRQTDPDAF